MNPSDTPLTDAARFEINWTNTDGYRFVVDAAFAEQLERELNAQSSANEILKLELKWAMNSTQQTP